MSEKQSLSVRKGVGGKREGAGRTKGVPNKITTDLKEMILGALDGAGGIDYLQERAQDPKTASAFLTLVGKVLPLQVTGDKDNPVSLQIQKIERVIVRPADKDA